MAKEVINRIRKEEKMFFGYVDYPKRARLHMYLSILIGALVVCANIYAQLPADFDMENLEGVTIDPATWMAFPFIYLSVYLDEKRLYRQICDHYRALSEQEQIGIHDIAMQQMADQTIAKMWPARIFSIFVWCLGWFFMFNMCMMGMFWMIESNWI